MNYSKGLCFKKALLLPKLDNIERKARADWQGASEARAGTAEAGAEQFDSAQDGVSKMSQFHPS